MMNAVPPPVAPKSTLPIGLVMAAVLAWGLYLAVGATLFDQDLRWRKGLIVIGFVVAFLGLWLVILAARHGTDRWRASGGVPPGRPPDGAVLWSVPSIVSFLLVMLGTACLFGSWILPAGTSVVRLVSFTWPPALIVAVIAAMIGLSDPRVRRGKWLALLGLLAILSLIAGWLYLGSQ